MSIEFLVLCMVVEEWKIVWVIFKIGLFKVVWMIFNILL